MEADGAVILTDRATVSSYAKTGGLRWRENIFNVLNGAVVDLAIAPSGTIYASSANALIALNPDSGKPLWAQPLVASSGEASGPLGVDSQGTAYVGSSSACGVVQEKLTGVDPAGTRRGR